jgi:hypothetical protein
MLVCNILYYLIYIIEVEITLSVKLDIQVFCVLSVLIMTIILISIMQELEHKTVKNVNNFMKKD